MDWYNGSELKLIRFLSIHHFAMLWNGTERTRLPLIYAHTLPNSPWFVAVSSCIYGHVVTRTGLCPLSPNNGNNNWLNLYILSSSMYRLSWGMWRSAEQRGALYKRFSNLAEHKGPSKEVGAKNATASSQSFFSYIHRIPPSLFAILPAISGLCVLSVSEFYCYSGRIYSHSFARLRPFWLPVTFEATVN